MERKTAIVSGAASGLGRAIAVELARQGWRVALADVNEAGSRETLALVEQAGGQGQVEQLDVAQEQSWLQLRAKLQAEWPRLDLLVNNAGVALAGDFERLSLDDWRWILGINLFGVIHGCHTMIPWMKTNINGAHIVNIASLAAVASAPGMAPYNIAKAGVLSLSETLYGELAEHRIGVTAVCPSFVPTNIIKSGRFPSEAQRNLAADFLRRSRTTPEAVASKVVQAVRKKKLYLFVPLDAYIVWRLKRLAPVALLKWARRVRDRHARRLEQGGS